MWLIEVFITSDVMIKKSKGTARYVIRATRGESVVEQAYSMKFLATTRNRSYLEAALEACGRIKAGEYELKIICDQEQVVYLAQKLDELAKHSYRKASGESYANADLWKIFHKKVKNVVWEWTFLPREELSEVCTVSVTQ